MSCRKVWLISLPATAAQVDKWQLFVKQCRTSEQEKGRGGERGAYIVKEGIAGTINDAVIVDRCLGSGAHHQRVHAALDSIGGDGHSLVVVVDAGLIASVEGSQSNACPCHVEVVPVCILQLPQQLAWGL